MYSRVCSKGLCDCRHCPKLGIFGMPNDYFSEEILKNLQRYSIKSSGKVILNDSRYNARANCQRIVVF